MWCARHDAAILQRWRDTTVVGIKTFIADEVALHLVLPHCKSVIATGGQYNCSPYLHDGVSNPVVWHFHGEKHLSKPRNAVLWWPRFLECWHANVGNVREWAPAGDKALCQQLHEQGLKTYGG